MSQSNDPLSRRTCRTCGSYVRLGHSRCPEGHLWPGTAQAESSTDQRQVPRLPVASEATENAASDEIEEMGELPTLPLGTTTFSGDSGTFDPGSAPPRICPFCAEEIKPAAIKCKHCQADLLPRQSTSVPTRNTPAARIGTCQRCATAFSVRGDFPSSLAKCNRCGGAVVVSDSHTNSARDGAAWPTPPSMANPAYMVVAPVVQTRTSGNAIAGFVLAFFCSPLGLIFSMVGYDECMKSRGMIKGEGLAVAGAILSIIGIVLGLMIFTSR